MNLNKLSSIYTHCYQCKLSNNFPFLMLVINRNEQIIRRLITAVARTAQDQSVSSGPKIART